MMKEKTNITTSSCSIEHEGATEHGGLAEAGGPVVPDTRGFSLKNLFRRIRGFFIGRGKSHVSPDGTESKPSVDADAPTTGAIASTDADASLYTIVSEDTIASVVDKLFDRADECYEAGNWQGAIVALTEILRLEPSNEQAYNNRGVAYSNLNEDDKAVADYTEALRLKPDYFAPYFCRAMLYNGQGDHKKALEDITEALRLDPKFARAYYERGIVRAAWHEHSAACADFTEAIRLDRNFYQAYMRRAGTYIMRNEFNRAVPDLKEALRIKPNDEQAKSMLNRVRRR